MLYSLVVGNDANDFFSVDPYTGLVTVNRMVSLDTPNLPNRYVVSVVPFCFALLL